MHTLVIRGKAFRGALFVRQAPHTRSNDLAGTVIKQSRSRRDNTDEAEFMCQQFRHKGVISHFTVGFLSNYIQDL